jgi:hypothetical protein
MRVRQLAFLVQLRHARHHALAGGDVADHLGEEVLNHLKRGDRLPFGDDEVMHCCPDPTSLLSSQGRTVWTVCVVPSEFVRATGTRIPALSMTDGESDRA